MPPNANLGGTIVCTMSMGSGSVVVVRPNVLIEGKPAANILDFVPMTNVPPMGMCTSLANPTVAAATSAALGVLTPMPCVPVTVSPWTPQAPKTLIAGAPALTTGSTCNCAWAGVIMLTNGGATKTLSN
jgi:uncharacterized Zn-binding protein involved in type VI secretion